MIRLPPGWNSKGHFFGAAAQAMRNIMVDRARAKGRDKRKADGVRISLSVASPAADDELSPEDLLALDEALDQLMTEHPRKAQVVMLRFFAGQTMEDIARMLGENTRTIERDWAFARTWLFKRVKGLKDGAG